MIIQKVPGQIKNYKSIDTVTSIGDVDHFPQEFLNSLNSFGLPPHKLTLKIGVPTMRLRNLIPPAMCDETRLIIKELIDNLSVTIIFTGPAAG